MVAVRHDSKVLDHKVSDEQQATLVVWIECRTGCLSNGRVFFVAAGHCLWKSSAFPLYLCCGSASIGYKVL